MSACKACHATILWATTPAGKAVPLDPNPRDDGNLTITSQVPLRVRYLDADVFPDLPRYVSHFATCEFASEFRNNPTRKKAQHD